MLPPPSGNVRFARTPTFSTTPLSGPRSAASVPVSSIGIDAPEPSLPGRMEIVADCSSMGPSVMWTGSWISRPALPVKYNPFAASTPSVPPKSTCIFFGRIDARKPSASSPWAMTIDPSFASSSTKATGAEPLCTRAPPRSPSLPPRVGCYPDRR